MILIGTLMISLLVLLWIYMFHPDNRIELSHPQEKSYRSFTENRSWLDTSVILLASDWPWTFGSPRTLGGFATEPGDPEIWVNWSGDGSVLAVRSEISSESEPSSYFSSAYDYREHHLLSDHSQITKLLESRGGIGPSVENPDEPFHHYEDKDDPFPLPVWGWLTPILLFGAGIEVCRRNNRRLKRKHLRVES